MEKKIILLLLVLTACLQIKRRALPDDQAPTASLDESAPHVTTVYKEDQIRQIRKLVADAIDNNFFEETAGKASIKQAMLQNPAAVALIIDNLEVLSQAFDPAVASLITAEFHRAFGEFAETISKIDEISTRGIIDKEQITQLAERLKKEALVKKIISAVYAIPDSIYAEYDATLARAIDAYQFADVDQALESIYNLPLPENLGDITNFLRDSLKFYFKELVLEDKRRVLATVIRNTMPHARKVDLARALVMGAGPIFQKNIQKFSDGLAKSDQKNPELAELKAAFDVVKDGLLANPSYETKRNFLEISRRTNEQLTLETVKSLGQASVGVAFLVDIKEKGQQPYRAVYKELRTNILKIAQREAEFFRKIAEKNHQKKPFEAKLKEVLAEMNLENEYDNLTLAAKYYNDSSMIKKYYIDKKSSNLIKAVTRVEEIPRSPHYLTMKLAPGESLKSILSETKMPTSALDLRRQKIKLLVATSLMNDLVEKWTMVGFFIGHAGVFHADLHAGNIFVYVDTEWYLAQLVGTPDSGISVDLITTMMHIPHNARRQLLTMIDFGILAKIDKAQRSGLLNFLIAVLETHSSEGLLQGLEALSPAIKKDFLNLSRREDIKNKIEHEFARPGDAGAILAAIVTLLAAHKLDIPQNFANFADVMGMFDNNFELLKKRINALGFYHQSMEDLFEFKKVLAGVIEAQIGIIPSARLRAAFRFIPFVKDATAYPDAPTINYENMKVLLRKKVGI